MIDKIEVVSNPAIGYPASEIFYYPRQGEVVRHAEMVTPMDYTFGIDRTLAQLRRMAGDLGIAPRVMDGLNAFVTALPAGNLDLLREAFAAHAS